MKRKQTHTILLHHHYHHHHLDHRQNLYTTISHSPHVSAPSPWPGLTTIPKVDSSLPQGIHITIKHENTPTTQQQHSCHTRRSAAAGTEGRNAWEGIIWLAAEVSCIKFSFYNENYLRRNLLIVTELELACVSFSAQMFFKGKMLIFVHTQSNRYFYWLT